MAKIHLREALEENPQEKWPWCWCGAWSLSHTGDPQKATCKRCLLIYAAWKRQQAQT